jgi:uncharacterized membrane protein
MTREEYLALCSKRYDELQSLKKIDNFYDYESEFVTIMKDLSKDVSEKQLSELSADRRKKNTHPIWRNKYCQQPSF